MKLLVRKIENIEIHIKRLERIDRKLRELEGLKRYDAPEIQETAKAFFKMVDDPYFIEFTKNLTKCKGKL